MKWLVLLLVSMAFVGDTTVTSVKVICDFEDGVDDWDNTMSNVKKKPKIETVDDAKAGKKAAKITYFAGAKSTDWTLLKCGFDEWPAEGTHLSFWMKSTADTTHVQVKLSEMKDDHQNFEGFHKEIEVGTEWKQYRIPLSEFEYLWGMGGGDKTLQKENLSNIAFAQPDVMKEMVLFVDQIEIVKEEKK